MASFVWPPETIDQTSTGIAQINGDATAAQLLVTGTGGTDFTILDNGTGTHTFELPSASATARGVITTGTQTIAGAKTFSATMTLGADLLSPAHGDIGAQTGQLSGTDYRPRNIFSQNCLVVGDVLGNTPPYGLNSAAGTFNGVIAAGNTAVANTAVFLASTTLFQGTAQSFLGFAKDGTFANLPVFRNLNTALDVDVYFSTLHLSSSPNDFIKFGGDGTLTMLAASGAAVYSPLFAQPDDAVADANPASDVMLRASDKTAGTGDGGNVLIFPGTSFGGNAGSTRIPGSVLITTDDPTSYSNPLVSDLDVESNRSTGDVSITLNNSTSDNGSSSTIHVNAGSANFNISTVLDVANSVTMTAGGNSVLNIATDAASVVFQPGLTPVLDVGSSVIAATVQVRMASLGVGNSAPATVAVGLLAKKIEVFDASGVSLGFIPVYASIT